MHINAQTKIAALIKHRPDALEAIIKLSPDFKKLRNPVLRKLMAGRTSIAMASKIGGCTPQNFFDSLKAFGFEANDLVLKNEEHITEQKVPPDFIKERTAQDTVTLDVRSTLAAGNDPLRLIQQTVKSLKKGQTLKIINTFEPTPLIKLLEKQGFACYVDVVEEGLLETYFYKENETEKISLEAKTSNANDWDELVKKHEKRLQEIDVRHLEMPLPMITILETLEKMSIDQALHVHHKRIPVFLLTELNERGFDYRIKEVENGEVFLLIFRQKC